MSKLNLSSKGKSLMDKLVRLAGGHGVYAARQDSVSLLKRVVMANLLWENIAYIDGEEVSAQIERLVPQCPPQDVYDIAVAARTEQKLRHTPLFIAVVMCRYPDYAKLVGSLLPRIITRADMLSDFLALYWRMNGGKKSLSHQAAAGLAEAFHNFDEYQFSKYDRDCEVKLRDVMFLCHPKPCTDAETELFGKIADRRLVTPDTWEVALSRGDDKKATWERLIVQRKIGALAFLRNLANMRMAGVDKGIIDLGFGQISTERLLPFDFLKAYRMNQEFERQIEDAMFRSISGLPRLKGRSLFVVDVSGSMEWDVSSKSDLTRLDCAMAMAMLAAEVCDDFELVCTAGYDGIREGNHAHVPYPRHGFGLIAQISEMANQLGGGGIFTRQCLEWCKAKFAGTRPFDRIIVFSDSQDCDYPDKCVPQPFGRRNYICDISCCTHGIAYKGLWTAEISGFSEHFLTYIANMEELGI